MIIVLSYLNVGNRDEVQLMKLILVLEGMLLNLNRSLWKIFNLRVSLP